jgi:hypothetical protein
VSSFLHDLFYFNVVSSYTNKKQHFDLELTKRKKAKIIALVSSHNLLDISARVCMAVADKAYEYITLSLPNSRKQWMACTGQSSSAQWSDYGPVLSTRTVIGRVGGMVQAWVGHFVTPITLP